MNNSSVEIALALPEILENIFEHADENTNASSICVCWEWFAACQKVLWYSVTTERKWHGLLSLLGPISIDDEQSKVSVYSNQTGISDNDLCSLQYYERIPMLKDWERFELYAQFIRVLYIIGPQTLYTQCLWEIADSRPTTPLLPNLNVLRYEGDGNGIYYGSLFMHSTVQKFSIGGSTDITQTSSNRARQAIDSISRMPQLVHLRLGSFPISISNMLGVIEELKCLEQLIIPLYQIDTRTMERASRLPLLKHLGQNQEEQVFEFGRFSPKLPAGAFPVLVHLSFAADVLECTALLRQTFFPSRIRTLKLHMVRLQSCVNISALFATVAQQCPELEHFLLSDVGDDKLEEYIVAGAQEIFQLSLDQIKALFPLKKLTSLTIRHEFSIILTTDDIALIASAFPLIETLLLNPRPIQATESLTPLSALPLLAQGCPNLFSLGLFVSTDRESLTTFQAQNIVKFKSLNMLSLGASPQIDDDASNCLFFLAQFLPPSCRITDSVPYWMSCNPLLEDILMFRSNIEGQMAHKMRLLEDENRLLVEDNRLLEYKVRLLEDRLNELRSQ